MLAEFVAALDADGPRAAAGPSRWALAAAQRCSERMVAGLAPDRAAELAPLIAAATEFTVAQLVVSLRGEGVAGELSPDQRAIIQRLAGDDQPFREIVVALREVQHFCVADLIERAEDWSPPRRQELVRSIADEVAAFVDRTIDRVIVTYLAERERVLADRLTDRRALVAGLLRGELIDQDTVRRVLDLDLAGHHLGLVCWAPTPGLATETARELERTARRVADLLRCPSVLTLTVDGDLWVWVGRSVPFRRKHVEALHPAAGSAAMAVGSPGAGAEGFRRTHHTALAARRVTELSASAAAVTLHHDVALLALLLTDPERAAWFVEDELGPLADRSPAQAVLRATLRAFLDEGMSLVAAAERLHVHRNTVVYRLRRAEEQLGPISRRPQELHAAVLLADALARDE